MLSVLHSQSIPPFLPLIWREVKASESRQEKRSDELRGDMKELRELLMKNLLTPSAALTEGIHSWENSAVEALFLLVAQSMHEKEETQAPLTHQSPTKAPKTNSIRLSERRHLCQRRGCVQ